LRHFEASVDISVWIDYPLILFLYELITPELYSCMVFFPNLFIIIILSGRWQVDMAAITAEMMQPNANSPWSPYSVVHLELGLRSTDQE
jgi:hypothetical protein